MNPIQYRRLTAPGGFDPLAESFIDRAGITDAGQQAAFNIFARDLRGCGLALKILAFFPNVGTTVSSQQQNFMTDATSLSFPTPANVNLTDQGVSALGSGDTAQAQFATPKWINDNIGQSFCFGMYLTTPIPIPGGFTRGLMGYEDTVPAQYFKMDMSNTGSGYIRSMHGPTSNRPTWSIAGNKSSLFVSSLDVTGAPAVPTNVKLFNAGGQVGNNPGGANATWDGTVVNDFMQYPGSRQDTVSVCDVHYQNRKVSCFLLAELLNDTEQLCLYNAIQALQVALGRDA